MNIREIAKLAGVSVATVSRCLNQPDKVSDDTREKITNIISDYAYTPSPTAQSLSTGQTHMIACVVPTLRNEFFNQLVEGCQQALLRNGYQLLIYPTGRNARCFDHLNQRAVDGLVISGTDFGPDVKERLSKLTIPYVLIENSEDFEGICENPKAVYINDYAGVQMALAHLYAGGNRTFGVVSFEDDNFVTRRRDKAVSDFFDGHRGCVVHMEKTDYTDLNRAMAACRALLAKQPRPTSIFTYNDMIAAGVLRCLHSCGVAVPDEIELIGFDDIPFASFLTPSLSTVAAPNRSLGEKAADILLDVLRGENAAVSVLYPVELKLRESTRPIRGPRAKK